MVDLARQNWRDFEVDGVAASGKHKPNKAKIRQWGTWVEGVINAFTSNGGLVYATRALLYADLLHGANTSAWVVSDSTGSYNGIYQKSGISGAGAWTRIADLPYSFIACADAGAGTANAIVATSNVPAPTAAGAALFICNVFEANSGAVTLALNGAAAKPVVTNSGNALSTGYLVAGMQVVFVDDGTNWRLVSDVASAAIQAAAEAAQAAAELAAANAALYDGIWFDTVVLLLADLTRTYGNTTAGDYIRTRSEGFAYEVAASGASDHHVTTGGGLKLYVRPDAGGEFNLFAFGAAGDGSDDRTFILAAIDAAHDMFVFGLPGVGGAKIVTMPGANHAFSGRIRLRPGVTIDFGIGGAGGRLTALDANGGIEQVAGSGLRAELRATHASFTGPLHEIADAKSTELSFGVHDRATWFDVAMRGNNQAGSAGLILHSTTSAGIAWVKGKATATGFDFPFDLKAEGAGSYVNENWLDMQAIDAVEFCRLIVDGGIDVAANRIKLTTQTISLARAKRALEVQGAHNQIELISWDWATSRVDPASDGTQVLFTELSGGNVLTGWVARPLTDRQPAIIDLAPPIRKNRIYANDKRYQNPSNEFMLPQSYMHVAPVADMHDELAYGYYRWRNQVVAGASVTASGATPPTTADLKAIFQPDASQLAINSATEAIITIDFGSVKAGGDFSTIAVAFNGNTTKPDKCKVEFSSDNITWTTQVSCGYDGEPMPHILYRCDGGGLSNFRYAKLTMENDSAKNLRVARWSILGHGINVTQGAYARLVNPQVHGSLDIQREFGGEGLKIDATKVVGPRDTGWTTGTGTALKGAFASYAGATHTGAYVQATIQALDDAAKNASQRVLALETMLRAHGLIN